MKAAKVAKARLKCRGCGSTFETRGAQRAQARIDRFAFACPGRYLAPCYSVEFGWFIAGLSSAPTYYQTANEAREALAEALDRGDVS